jgi:TPR repeat protein
MTLSHRNQGRHWWRQAVSAGHPDSAPMAMVNLGRFEHQQGSPDQARHWYQQAISTGHLEMTSVAQQRLRDLDRHERDRERGEDFGRYGYLAHADPTLMKQEDHGPEHR